MKYFSASIYNSIGRGYIKQPVLNNLTIPVADFGAEKW